MQMNADEVIFGGQSAVSKRPIHIGDSLAVLSSIV